MRWAAAATQSSWEEEEARPLPIPWTKLSKVMRPKGGNAGVIIAAPGVGKTTLLLNWAAKADIPTLYLSADTAPQDITAQLGSLSTGHERKKVEERLMASPTWRREYGQAVYRAYPNLVLDFSPRPTMRDIRYKALALTELWGVTPRFIVMDTASDVAMSDMGNNAEWQRVWLQAKQIARELNAVFFFAHHVKTGPARSGRTAPEMSDGLWGSDQFAEFVLGLWTPRAGQVGLMVRKNRTGPKDVPVSLEANLSRADISDPEEERQPPVRKQTSDNVVPMRRSDG